MGRGRGCRACAADLCRAALRCPCLPLPLPLPLPLHEALLRLVGRAQQVLSNT